MFGLEWEYEDYIRFNGGSERCGICRRPPKKRKLQRDHDHQTGLPRGLLCYQCNKALPYYVNLSWLQAAIEYLTRYEERVRGED